MVSRLPLRLRLGVAALGVLALVVVGGATAAVQYGAGALVVSGGFVESVPWTSGTQWVGIEVTNATATPITLRAVEARESRNIEILDTRVIGPQGSHLLMLSSPLTPDIQAAVDDSRPVDGFVLPPHSDGTYQIAVRFRPRADDWAVLSRTAVVYSVWGLDHGAISDGVYCVRAPGAQRCGPYQL